MSADPNPGPAPEDRAAEARQRLELWRQLLNGFDAAPASQSVTVIAELLGSASVATMAEIEGFMRDLVNSITQAIDDEHIPVSSLRPELRVIHAHAKFDSIRTLTRKNDNFWSRRTEVTTLHMSNDIASLPSRTNKNPQAPLRGTTISERDISEVARMFGFHDPTHLQADARIGTALKKLSGYRNDYAHAVVPPTEVFPTPEREVSNVIGYIGHICDLLDTLADDWRMVLSERLYLDVPKVVS